MRVLVVEDEPSLADYVVALLRMDGFDAEAVGTAAQALLAVVDRAPDLVLLDVGLPDADGLTVCRQLRRRPGYLPVILLTGRDRREDELAGLAAAADDYVTKPIDAERLLARVRTVLRRSGGGRRTVVVGELEIDLDARAVRRGGRAVHVTRREFDLLAFLVEHPGRVFGREQLLDRVWGPRADVEPDTVTRHVSRLRALIEERPTAPQLLLTRPAVGYFWAAT